MQDLLCREQNRIFLSVAWYKEIQCDPTCKKKGQSVKSFQDEEGGGAVFRGSFLDGLGRFLSRIPATNIVWLWYAKNTRRRRQTGARRLITFSRCRDFLHNDGGQQANGRVELVSQVRLSLIVFVRCCAQHRGHKLDPRRESSLKVFVMQVTVLQFRRIETIQLLQRKQRWKTEHVLMLPASVCVSLVRSITQFTRTN